MSGAMIPVLWSAPSIERPGYEVVLCELDAATGRCQAFEGKDGEFEPISRAADQRKILEKAELVLRGDPSTLADGRVLTAMAAVFLSFFEKGVEPARAIALPKKKDPG